MPRIDGSVTQLFTRMIAAGKMNVREMTCKLTTNVKEDQTTHGMRGRITRKGMRMYAIGEKGRNVRNDVSVPSLFCIRGYKKIWSGRPMRPTIAVANPTRDDGRPSPPPKWKRPCLEFSGARGAGKNTNVIELKALVWKARRN